MLWTGDVVRAHHGRHYTVEHARRFTLPDEPPPVVVSGFSPQAVELAGRIGDGYMHVAPDAESVEGFRASGGAGKPCYGKLDTCVAADDATARRIAFETWPTSALEGEIGQELATPEHYEQARRPSRRSASPRASCARTTRSATSTRSPSTPTPASTT